MTERIARVSGAVIVLSDVLAHRPDGYLNIIRDDCMRLITNQGRLVDDQIIEQPIARGRSGGATEFSMTALVMQETK